MKSKNDPVLDALALCQEHGPMTQEALLDALKDLGWHETPANEAIAVATRVYLHQTPDGKLSA